MTIKEKLKVLDLAGVLQESQYFGFSCYTCKLIVRAGDCWGCPLFQSEEDHAEEVNLG